jgi:hypothetical protein
MFGVPNPPLRIVGRRHAELVLYQMMAKGNGRHHIEGKQVLEKLGQIVQYKDINY